MRAVARKLIPSALAMALLLACRSEKQFVGEWQTKASPGGSFRLLCLYRDGAFQYELHGGSDAAVPDPSTTMTGKWALSGEYIMLSVEDQQSFNLKYGTGNTKPMKQERVGLKIVNVQKNKITLSWYGAEDTYTRVGTR